MYVERVPNRSSPPAVLLRESYREGGRIKKRTLANLSKLPHEAVEAVRRVLRGEPLVNPQDLFTCVRSLPHGHVAAVLATLKQLGLHTLLARQPSRWRELAVALIVARVIDPQSKLATARALAPESAVSTLGEMLGLGGVDQHELYAAMDWLVERQAAIEQRLAKRHLEDHTLVLYDLTSSYLEGSHCPLARRGHSRDGKKGTLQIVFGLLCTSTGCPVAVEVFEGSTSDPNTVASQVAKLRQRFGLKRVVLVGDRGMLTAARIREDLAGVDGLRWITTLRAPTIRKLVAAGKVTPSLFDERDLAEITDEFPGERLVVCRNPLLAAEFGPNPLRRTARRLPQPAAGRRGAAPLQGGQALLLPSPTTTFTYPPRRRQDRGRGVDGLYIVRSNVEMQMDAAQTVRAYKNLSKVERAFRSLKSVDLKVRPLHHRRADRVRAHVLLCMLAYYVEWHMRGKLKPLLFDDHDPQAGEQRRHSVVAPAKRSPAALAKASRKRTPDDLPVHSFRTLLTDLGTLSVNTLRVADTGASFPLQTRPTAGAAALLRTAGGDAADVTSSDTP